MPPRRRAIAKRPQNRQRTDGKIRLISSVREDKQLVCLFRLAALPMNGVCAREIPLTMNVDRLRPEEIPLTPTPLPKGEGNLRAFIAVLLSRKWTLPALGLRMPPGLAGLRFGLAPAASKSSPGE